MQTFDRLIEDKEDVLSPDLEGEHLHNRILQWIDYELPSTSSKVSITIHLDELLKYSIAREKWVEVSLNAFFILSNTMINSSDKYMASLSFSLSSRSDFNSKVKDRFSLDEQLNRVQPPSLSVIDRDMLKFLWPHEEYIYPISPELLGINMKNTYVFYRAFRGFEDIINDWDFSGEVRVDYYPQSLLF